MLGEKKVFKNEREKIIFDVVESIDAENQNIEAIREVISKKLKN